MERLIRFLLLPVGTYGDVAPFLKVGVRLKKRGHEVVVGTASRFRQLVQRHGLGFAPVLDEPALDRVLTDPRLNHRRHFFETLARGLMCPAARPIVELVESQPDPAELVLVAALAGGPGARIASELTGARMVSMWLQPSALRSAVEPPVLSGVRALQYVPRLLRRFSWWAIDRNADRFIAGPVNAIRRDLGLQPIRSVLLWLQSPERQIGLFPGWYCPPKPDWPSCLELVGFPSEPASERLPSNVEDYLGAGDPPVVITFGTAMEQAGDDFVTAAAACRILGLRAMLVSPREASLPCNIPPNAAAFGFVPLGALLPRARAIIHHAGIGTVVQALAAGVPQFGVAMAHDQPDNVARLRRLGAGDGVSRALFRSFGTAKVLKRLLGSPSVAATCKSLAARISQEDGIAKACDVLEASW